MMVLFNELSRLSELLLLHNLRNTFFVIISVFKISDSEPNYYFRKAPGCNNWSICVDSEDLIAWIV